MRNSFNARGVSKFIVYDTNFVPSYYEDHLLERVSLLELRLSQVMEQLAMAYEFISREVKSFQKDHTLLQSFFESINKINPDLSALLSKECLESFETNTARIEMENKQNHVMDEILRYHTNPNTELFSQLIKDGISLLFENEEKQGFRTLARAALLSPNNVPLLVFIGESLFRADKLDEAKKYLQNAYELAPQNENTLLLLAAIYADQGKVEKSRRFLSVLINDPKKSVSANYIWGILSAFEGTWTESIAAFKEILKYKNIPEIHYLIGCCYFQLNRYKTALRYFEKAVSQDAKFSDAWFMQSVIYRLLSDEREENTRYLAFEAKESGAQCLEFLRGKKDYQSETALPFLHFQHEKKQLLTGGARRLTQIFRELIIEIIE